jgi:AcrR family transcriptional regulator
MNDVTHRYAVVAMVENRGERSRNLVLTTAADLMAEVGVERLTVDEVARRSGVAKTTIYRHFPTKSALVAAAVNRCMEFPPFPDTGSVRGDLIACFEHAVKHSLDGRLGSIILSVMDAAQRDAELAVLMSDYTERRRRAVRTVLQRAVSRGDLPADLDVERTITLISGPIIYTKLMLRTPATPELVEHVIDNVLTSIDATANAEHGS